MTLYIYNSVSADINFIVRQNSSTDKWIARSYFAPLGELDRNDCNMLFDNDGQGYDRAELALLAAQHEFTPDTLTLDDRLNDPQMQEQARRQLALAMLGKPIR